MPRKVWPKRNPYLVLGLAPDSSERDIRRTYLARIRVVHPDRFDPQRNRQDWEQANLMAAELNEAFSFLRSENARARCGEQYCEQTEEWQAKQPPPPKPPPAFSEKVPRKPVLSRGEYELCGQVTRQTARAYLMWMDLERSAWIPKSVIVTVDDMPYSPLDVSCALHNGNWYRLLLASWFARKLWD